MNENAGYKYVMSRVEQNANHLDTALELCRMIAKEGNPELWLEIELMIDTIKEMEND